MINRIKKATFIMLSIAYIINLFAFDYHTHVHDYIIHLFYLLMVIGILWTKRLAVPILFMLILFHIVADWIIIGAFPEEALTESLMQLLIIVVLLWIVLLKERSTQRIKNIIDATNVGTWEWNLKTDTVRINDYFAEMLGYKKHELEPFNLDIWDALVHPDDIKESITALEAMRLNKHAFYEMDVRLKHKDGHYVWVHDRGNITKWSPTKEPLMMSGTHTDITARKALLAKEQYYQNFLANIIDYSKSGIAVHDKDLNYVFVSQKYLKQYNLQKENVIGKHHYDVFPDLPKRWRDVHQRALNGEVIHEDRDPFKRADGHIDWTRWECRPWYDENNAIAGIIIYTEVINDLIQNERALEQSRNRLQTVMDNLPIGLAVNTVLPEVEFEYINDNFASIYGTTKDALKTKNFWETVYHDETNRKTIKHMVETDTASGDSSKMEWHNIPIVLDDGTKKYINAYNTPLKGEKNSYISTVIDVTKRKELEQSLEMQNKELFIQKKEIEATLLAIGDGVISTDAEGIINTFNDIAETLTGYTKEEAIGKPFDDVFVIVNEATKEPLPSPVKRVIETQKMFFLANHTMLLTKDNKERIIEDSASPIKTESGALRGVILVFRDVTEKKQKQKQIEYLSLHDHLTGLYNRRYFTDKLASVDIETHYPLGLIMIDLNGLKILNDAYGHDTGDKALKLMSHALQETIKDRGVVSRIGGDEFTVVMSNTSEEEITDLKDRLNTRVQTVVIKNVTLSIAIGHAIKYKATDALSDVLKKAEDMMYKMKLVKGVSARNNTIQAILKTLTDKYVLERTHSKRVSDICYRIGKILKLNKDDLEELKLSGMFHDIGKISLPDKILNKPDRLTKDEYAIVKEHTGNGYQILRAADEYSDFAEHALYHHEHYDGAGYPDGLKGDDIPLFARIISVADAYEAMTSDRPYRKAMTCKEAIDELNRYKGSQFDPMVVNAFLKVYKTEGDNL